MSAPPVEFVSYPAPKDDGAALYVAGVHTRT